jgi:hypothetical protein
MATAPIFEKTAINTSTQFGSSAGTILETASAGERLQARLKGLTSFALEAGGKQAISEETRAKALQDVQSGNIDSEAVALIARETYRNTANAALMANVEVGAKNIGKQLVREQTLANKFDANSFNQSWNGYVKGTTSGIKDIVIKKNVEIQLNKMGQEFSGQIAPLQTKQIRDIQKDDLLSKLSIDTDTLKASFGINAEATMEAQNNIDRTLETMVTSNLIAPNTALVKRRQIYKDAYSNKQQRDFRESLDNGTAYKFYDNFKNADHFGILDESDIIKFRSSMLSQITTDVKVYENRLAEDTNKAEIKRKETTDEFDRLWINGELTPKLIDDALSNNQITLTDHKTYQIKANDSGPLFDNQAKLLTVTTHLLDVTEEEILNSPDFKHTTKTDLILKRRTELEDEANWLSTQSGHEARRRVREAFNIIDGTMMSKLDFNNTTMREYDDTYRKFFAEVESLPVEQRAAKSLLIADKWLGIYTQRKEDEKLARIQAKKDKKAEEEKKKQEDYDDSVTGKFMNLLEDKWNDTDAAKILEDLD